MRPVKLLQGYAKAQVCLLFAWFPSVALSQETQDQGIGNGSDASKPVAELTTEQAQEKIMRLEAELIMLKRSLGMDRQNKKILLPKQGIYVQADIGLQQREFAGENGITNLMFDPGLYGGVGIGYRYDRNFRFGFEYSQMNNAVSKIRPGIPIPVVDPVLGPIGTNANGTVRLDSYTLNAYYDLNGFGYEKRFRPYLGAGVGLMTSKISNLQPAFFPSAGVDRALNGENTQPTFNFQAGISYLFNRNTDFGTLMPNGARNWTLKTGMRYTF